MISKIGAPLQMVPNAQLDLIGIEEIAVIRQAAGDGVRQQRAQRPPQPIVRREIEPDFLSP